MADRSKKKKPTKKQPASDPTLAENAHAKATPSGHPPPFTPAVTVTVGQETLDATPMRLVQFLRGVGTLRAVREALRPVGYTSEEHARGWQLLHDCSGFVAETVDDGEVTAAIEAIDAWDEPTFTVAEAALRHRHPMQHAFVFHDLGPSQGVNAVVGAHTFLSRLDALESSPERAATRAADHAALATLAARGVTPDERRRVWALVRTAEELHDDTGAAAADLSATELGRRLREARAFYEEWSTIARTRVTRRDHLIRLGLAERRAPAADKKDEKPDAEPEAKKTDDAPKPA